MAFRQPSPPYKFYPGADASGNLKVDIGLLNKISRSRVGDMTIIVSSCMVKRHDQSKSFCSAMYEALLIIFDALCRFPFDSRTAFDRTI